MKLATKILIGLMVFGLSLGSSYFLGSFYLQPEDHPQIAQEVKIDTSEVSEDPVMESSYVMTEWQIDPDLLSILEEDPLSDLRDMDSTFSNDGIVLDLE